MKELIAGLKKANITYKLEEPLAQYTTWRVGGPAEIFVQADTLDVLKRVITLANETSTPFTLLGGGSNVLIADRGIRGLVIRNKVSSISVLGTTGADEQVIVSKAEPRLAQANADEYYSFAKIDYNESDAPSVLVEIASGTYLPFAINSLIQKGITGLQWFAGIPGSVGGSIYNNIHGGSKFLGEFVLNVDVLNDKGEVQRLKNDELEFDYDYSRFHHTGEVILSAVLKLYRGDKERALKTSIGWAALKKKQPHNSAGCCYQNITAAKQRELELISNSWGYIIEHKLGLKGKNIGAAHISEYHAAFIETERGATANDVLELMNLVSNEAERVLGIRPVSEIFFLGFTPQEIANFR